MKTKQDVSLYICAFNWSDRSYQKFLKKKKKNCSDKKCINTTSNYEYSTSKLYMYEKCDFY